MDTPDTTALSELELVLAFGTSMHNSWVMYPPSRIWTPHAFTYTTRHLQNDIIIHSWQHKMSTYFPLSRQILEMKMNKENDHLWKIWSYNFKLSFNTNCVIWDFFKALLQISQFLNSNPKLWKQWNQL